MSDSTIEIIIEEKDKPEIFIVDMEDGSHYSSSHADVRICQRGLHLSVTLPKSTIRVLGEKIQEFLDAMEAKKEA